MTLKPFSEDVLEKLVEIHYEVCLPLKDEDLPIGQYLVEMGLARFEPLAEVFKLTDKGNQVYQRLVEHFKKELSLY